MAAAIQIPKGARGQEHRTRRWGALFAAIAVTLLIGPARAECPSGDRMSHFITIDRTAVPMRELWDWGADDFGVSGDRLHLRVCPHMLDQLAVRGIAYEIITPDIDEAYRQSEAHRPQRRAESFLSYHNLDSTVRVMQAIVERYPDIAALEVIGRSIEGRPIHALRLSDNAATIEPDEPGMVVTGCHHAREWISVEVPLFFADYLVDHYRKDGTVTRLLKYSEIWIVPVLNPDGYHYSTTAVENRWWRKNRRNNGDGTFGVDPNRNYSTGFGDDAGSSGLTYSEVYRGTAAFSEPETQAIRSLMQERSFGRTFATALSYHNYSQLVMYPNGHTLDPVPNAARYEALAAEMTRRINDSHTDRAHDYIFGQPSHLLYIVSGAFEDWAHHALAATAFIIELRPAGYPYFELPPDEILPTCQENLPAFLYLAETTLIPNARLSDADLDGFVGADDYCATTPASAEVDGIGCGPTEQDLDRDGVANLHDICRNSLPAQQVAADGCRVPTLFTLHVGANVESIEIDVAPRDIDAAAKGDTESAGFSREYAQETAIALTAPELYNGNRFVRWVIAGQPQPDRQHIVLISSAADIDVEAVYVVPRRVEILGEQRLPDEDQSGLAFVSTYSVQILFDDGSTEIVRNADWSIGEDAVGAMTAHGELLAYDVGATEGEVEATLTASVDFGGRQLVANPLPISVFDARTRAARCREITLTGPERVESNAGQFYQANVRLDGETRAQVRSEQTRWSVAPAERSGGGRELQSAPASVSAEGALTAEWVAADTSVVLRAAYINDNDSVCLAEKVITIGAGDAADDPALRPAAIGPATCGAVGVIGFLGLVLGLAALWTTRR